MAILDGKVKVFRQNHGEHPARWAVRPPVGGFNYGSCSRVMIAEPELVVVREHWKPGQKGTVAWVVGYIVDYSGWHPLTHARPDIVHKKPLPELNQERVAMRFSLDTGYFEPQDLDLTHVLIDGSEFWGYLRGYKPCAPAE